MSKDQRALIQTTPSTTNDKRHLHQLVIKIKRQENYIDCGRNENRNYGSDRIGWKNVNMRGN